MSSPNPVDAPQHVLQLLSELHKKSLKQEALISKNGKFISTTLLGKLEDKDAAAKQAEFDQVMLDKFIALDEDKCQFTYQLINAMGATNVIEAGTSFGVSTIYLALAVAKTTPQPASLALSSQRRRRNRRRILPVVTGVSVVILWRNRSI